MITVVGEGAVVIGKKRFANDISLTEIEIADGVKTISDFAFEGCINLKSILLCNGLRRLSKGAFSGCTSLRSIILPQSLVSLQANVFAGCVSLERIVLSESIRRNIEKRTFADCTGLRYIDIPEGVSKICAGAFYNCVSLKSVGFSNGNILIEAGAFEGCECLSEQTKEFIEAHTIDKNSIDIKSKGENEAGRLSNYTERRFFFDGVECGSIEGVLQSFKCPDTAKQREICALVGGAAKSAGEHYNNWMEKQTLYWNGTEYSRGGAEYQSLLDRLYDAVYEQDGRYRADLKAVRGRKLDHTMGVNDMARTVLTRKEFIDELERLQKHEGGKDRVSK